MTAGPPLDDPCPSCGSDVGARYQAEITGPESSRHRVYCAVCGHTTGWQSTVDLARLEWRLGNGG